MTQKVREEISEEPQGSIRFWLYSLGGCIVFLIGLFFVFLPPEPILRFTGLGQASVGLGMVLWGLSQVLSANKMGLVIGLRIGALAVFVVGIATALLWLFLA